MKKRLLLSVFAVIGAMSSYAYNIGDYIYSHTAKFKTMGENLVLNGGFSLGDGTEGWNNELGGALSTTWKVVTSCGPNGENAIESQGASTAEGDALAAKWQLDAGVYVISYQVYTVSNITSSVSSGNTNYVNFFANTTGDNTVERAIAAAESWKGEQWTEVVDTIFVNADKEYLVLNINNVSEGIRFTNFIVQKVYEVYDSRVIDRTIEYAEKLLQEPDLAEGRDEFEGIVSMMKEAVETPENIEDKDAAEALIEAFNGAFDEFMNQNGGNTIGTTGDWTQIGSKGYKGLTTFGAWKFDGGRWGFSPNDGNLGRPENDGYVASAGIQKGWEQNWAAYIESSALQTGQKYFFSIEAQAVAASSTQISENYGADYNTPIVGGENYKMFIGNDTLNLEGDTISGYYWKRYYMIATVPADADAVRAGFLFHFPSTMGERASLRNPEFRLIGKSEIQINYEAALKDVIIQQTELGKRLTNYPTDIASYKWAKDSLARAIESAQPVYEASFDLVKADGSCDLTATEENVDILKNLYQSLLDEVNALGRAKNYVIAQNAIFGNVQNAINAAQAVLDDDLYQNGDKATFQKAISDAQTLLDNTQASTSDATRENDEPVLQQAIETLNEAVEAFKASANLQPVVDIDFSNPATPIVEGDTDADMTYAVVGNAGQMEFESGMFTSDNSEGGTTYTLGVNGELSDVLRVGKSNATVALPAVGDNEVLRVSFDMWVGNLVKRYMVVELQNEAGERVAGFKFNRYDGVVDYNDFNDAENTGLDLMKYVSAIGKSGTDNAMICVDNNKSSFELIVDYKNKTMKGILVNGQNGTCNGAALPMPAAVDEQTGAERDLKIVKFVLSSTYDNADRRSFFDNMKAYKYEPKDASGIETVNAAAAENSAIYTLTGVKVNKAVKAGLYIQQGKKYLVK